MVLSVTPLMLKTVKNHECVIFYKRKGLLLYCKSLAYQGAIKPDMFRINPVLPISFLKPQIRIR